MDGLFNTIPTARRSRIGALDVLQALNPGQHNKTDSVCKDELSFPQREKNKLITRQTSGNGRRSHIFAFARGLTGGVRRRRAAASQVEPLIRQEAFGNQSAVNSVAARVDSCPKKL